MFKLLRTLIVCALIAGAFWLGGVVRDRQSLNEDLIRLHVVAASDSEEDQALKLQVRDAVLAFVEEAADTLESVEAAKSFLAEHLEDIREIAENVIAQAGFTDDVTVTLTEEVFDTRVYDTFTLPAGVYESLRIVVGEGEGQNWWCVVFPRLCVPAAVEEFEDTAVGAGFSDTLSDTISNDGGYEIRFWLLDCLGKIQNFFHGG